MLQLVFTSSDKIVSRLIRRQTWNKYSHVAITDGTYIWESTHSTGVHRILYGDWLDRRSSEVKRPVEVWVPDEARTIEYLDSRVGHGYDWLNLAGHICNCKLGSPDLYVCSEYLAEALNETSNRSFFEHRDYFKVAPRHLFISAYARSKVYKAVTVLGAA